MKLEELGFKKIRKKQPKVTLNLALNQIILDNIETPSKHCSVYYKHEDNKIFIALNFNEKEYEVEDNVIKCDLSELKQYTNSKILVTENVRTSFDNIIIAEYETKIKVKKEKERKCTFIIELNEEDKKLIEEFTKWLIDIKKVSKTSISTSYKPAAKIAVTLGINETLSRKEIKEKIENKLKGLYKKNSIISTVSVANTFSAFLSWRLFKRNEYIIREYIENKYNKLIYFDEILQYIVSKNISIGEIMKSERRNLIEEVILDVYEAIKTGTIYDVLKYNYINDKKVIEKTFKD